MESIQLNITGMKCGGCVSTVEKILKNSDGIENVSVNLLTESAYFEITQKHIEIEQCQVIKTETILLIKLLL